MNSIGAIIAAAGLSSRMGHFKPLLPLGNKTIIEHVVSKFQQAGVATVVVVTGHNRELLDPVVRQMGAVAVHNPNYANTGMYESIKLGVTYLLNSCDAFFVQPCDMPLVTIETMHLQIAAMSASDCQVVHPSYMGRKHGHPVLFSHKTIDTLMAHDGEGGLRTAIRKIPGKRIDVTVVDQGILIDADRPEDYQAIITRFNNQSLPISPVQWPFQTATV